jgi:hypothetical protein
MARRCGCSGSSCSCKVIAGRGARVRGSGSQNDPIVIDALPLSLAVQDSVTVDMSLTGTGVEADPYIISAAVEEGVYDGKWTRWSGTQTAYNALGVYDAETLYLITGP